MIPENAVDLPSGPGLRVVLANRTSTSADLLVLEDGRTVVRVSVGTPAGLLDAEREEVLHLLASSLVSGEPARTTTEWRVATGNLAFQVSLPEGYAVWHDEDPLDGFRWEVASRTVQSPASIRFEESLPAAVRHRGPQRTVTVAREPRSMVVEPHAWSVNLGCACGHACWAEIDGDEQERERLLEALAGATRTERPCD
ncbi:MAG: hypothetical protein AB8I08_19305 [Sandaracinaceae bacterium]